MLGLSKVNGRPSEVSDVVALPNRRSLQLNQSVPSRNQDHLLLLAPKVTSEKPVRQTLLDSSNSTLPTPISVMMISQSQTPVMKAMTHHVKVVTEIADLADVVVAVVAAEVVAEPQAAGLMDAQMDESKDEQTDVLKAELKVVLRVDSKVVLRIDQTLESKDDLKDALKGVLKAAPIRSAMTDSVLGEEDEEGTVEAAVVVVVVVAENLAEADQWVVTATGIGIAISQDEAVQFRPAVNRLKEHSTAFSNFTQRVTGSSETLARTTPQKIPIHLSQAHWLRSIIFVKVC